jgi:drug/metabolite transporter (DMT)-like permease
LNKGSFIFPLMIIVASSSYGILSTIVKLSMEQGYTAAEAITSQYVFGFVLALVLVLCTQRQLPKLNRSGLTTIFFAGLFTATTGIVYGQALIYLPASLAVVMLFQFTWIGTLLDCLLKRRLPSRIEVISLGVLFIGTILAAGLIDTDLSSIPLKGWVLGFCSAFSFAIFIQFNARPIEGLSNIMRTFLMSIVALFITSLILTPEIIWNGQLSSGLWKYGLALGLFGVIFPIILFSIAAPKVGGALTSILSAMELPVAIIVSVIFLHEHLSSLQILGIVCVLFGMSLPTIVSVRNNRTQKFSQTL